MGGLLFFAAIIAWFCFCFWPARKIVCAKKSAGLVEWKRAAFYVITLTGISLVTGCEKFELDRQMEELCKKDGGVRVYETVKLPPEMFEPLGDPFPGWRRRPPSERLGNDYEYLFDVEYLVKGDPLKGQGRLQRYQIKIIRRADQKLMGESVSYGRSGGDFIALGHPTSNGCPVGQSSIDVIRQVFIKQGK